MFNIQKDEGDTPLIIASEMGHITTCILLIQRGATVDIQDKVKLHVLWCIHTKAIEWFSQERGRAY